MRRALILMSILGLAIGIFVWGAWRQSTLVNTNMYRTDQAAYMNYAKNMAQTNFQYVGGRNRMPLYPGLMSFFYRQGMSDKDFFECGKNVGIAIGLLGVIVAFLLFRQVAKPMDALTGALVTMFTVFAYKSPFFQAEVLFYTISLVLFYLLLSLVEKPNIRTAAFAGLVGGLGHLTKASVLPAVLLAGLITLLRGVLQLWQHHHGRDTTAVNRRHSRFLLNYLCCAIVLLGCFLIVVFPYIRTSKKRYGKYFYNVNSTFYIWYDSWEEAKQGTRAHDDRQGWPDMPEEQIPSFRKYIREHSFGEMVWRLTRGFCAISFNALRSYGYVAFMLLYGIMLLLLFYQNKDRVLPILLYRVHPCVILFIFGYFLGYTTLYAWYASIVSGNRFTLSLFLPSMLMIERFLSYTQSQNMSLVLFGKRITASRISPTVLLFLIVYVLTFFPYGISTMYGGN